MIEMISIDDDKNTNIRITSNCTYSCRFCQKENISDYSLRQLQTEKRLNEPIGSIKQFMLTGGDALLHSDLHEIIQELTDTGHRVSISTNGSQLNQQNLLQLKGKVVWIWVPLDSCLDERESLLGRGSGEHTSHIIHISSKIRELGIHLGLWTVVCQETYQENLMPLIRVIQPERWKIIPEPGLSCDTFRHFINRHSQVVLDSGRSPDFSFWQNTDHLCGYANKCLSRQKVR